MKKAKHDDIKDNALHRKLERILTRDWWSKEEFNDEEFHIYCTAVVYEADLFKRGFIGGEKYQELIGMSDERLREYLKNSKRVKRVSELFPH